MKLEELNESKVPATVMDKEMMCLAASPGAMGGNGEGNRVVFELSDDGNELSRAEGRRTGELVVRLRGKGEEYH